MIPKCNVIADITFFKKYLINFGQIQWWRSIVFCH